jgi:hypothetical protein
VGPLADCAPSTVPVGLVTYTGENAPTWTAVAGGGYSIMAMMAVQAAAQSS